MSGSKWTKLIANTMTMGPFSLLGLRNFEAAALPGMHRNLGATRPRGAGGRERARLPHGTAVRAACGLIRGFGRREPGDHDEDADEPRRRRTHRAHPRPPEGKGRTSEIEFISGAVSRRGRELGIPSPGNDAVTALDRRINRGEIPMGPANFELFKRALCATA